MTQSYMHQPEYSSDQMHEDSKVHVDWDTMSINSNCRLFLPNVHRSDIGQVGTVLRRGKEGNEDRGAWPVIGNILFSLGLWVFYPTIL